MKSAASIEAGQLWAHLTDKDTVLEIVGREEDQWLVVRDGVAITIAEGELLAEYARVDGLVRMDFLRRAY
jgi:hypothetical protein